MSNFLHSLGGGEGLYIVYALILRDSTSRVGSSTILRYPRLLSSVADPDPVFLGQPDPVKYRFLDPDPGKYRIRIRIQNPKKMDRIRNTAFKAHIPVHIANIYNCTNLA